MDDRGFSFFFFFGSNFVKFSFFSGDMKIKKTTRRWYLFFLSFLCYKIIKCPLLRCIDTPFFTTKW